MNAKTNWKECKKEVKYLGERVLDNLKLHDILIKKYAHRVVTEAIWPGMGDHSMKIHRMHNTIQNRSPNNTIKRKQIRDMYQRQKDEKSYLRIMRPWYY